MCECSLDIRDDLIMFFLPRATCDEIVPEVVPGVVAEMIMKNDRATAGHHSGQWDELESHHLQQVHDDDRCTPGFVAEQRQIAEDGGFREPVKDIRFSTSLNVSMNPCCSLLKNVLMTMMYMEQAIIESSSRLYSSLQFRC
jgi:hypothetical protein